MEADNYRQLKAKQDELVALLRESKVTMDALLAVHSEVEKKIAQLHKNVIATSKQLELVQKQLANNFPILEKGLWTRRLVHFDGKVFHTKYDKSDAIIKYSFPEGIRLDNEKAARLDVKAALDLWTAYVNSERFS